MRNRRNIQLVVAGLTAVIGAACTAVTEEQPPPPPAPVACTEASPSCDPGCSGGDTCVFNGGSCSCQPVCASAAPTCAGSGPNHGCDTGYFCNVRCECEAEETCLADAPTCAGSGPNNGCDAGSICAGDCTCQPAPAPTAHLLRPSRSSAVDISLDDSIVAMVNTDDGSVSFFNAVFGEETRIARVRTSRTIPASEPVSVVIHPDQTTAFVANRAAGSVSKITAIASAQAALDQELVIGAEPMGLALTPSGAQLWVTDWVAGKVVVIDTNTMQILRSIDAGKNPFAIAITNDGDADDDDEQALVTQFFARPRAGAPQVEGTDDGKEGVVQRFEVSTGRRTAEIPLAPIADCFTGPAGNPPQDRSSGCFPNQLWSIAIHSAFGKTRAYVASMAASPAGPVSFNHNVQAVVSVIDLTAGAEDVALTKNLNRLIKEQQIDTDGDDNQGRRFINTPSGIDFVNRDDAAIAYLSSAASDVVLRVVYLEDGTVQVGAAQAFNIPVGQNPQGLVVKHGSTNAGAYVANLISRDLSVISFRDQQQTKTVVSTDQPTDPRSAAFKIWKGKRFFNTSTGIWSKEGWGSCQGCHPFGLTDNVTWKFAAGPRQTVSLDGQFASSDPSDMRALNWTAIFDETADFENNTRGVSGGKGALQNAQGPLVSPQGAPFSAILSEDAATRENHQALNGSLSFVAAKAEICTNANTCPDWNLIDLYIQSIKSPRGVASAEAAEGRRLFEEAGCNKCHAGEKWTVSRTFYRPDVFTGALPQRTFEANRAFTIAMDPTTLRTLPRDVNRDLTLVAGDDSDGGQPALKRQACNIRDVGTFGATGGSDETRDNGQAAQGRNGYNPPSLLSIATGAPYLHAGAARDLDDLLDARFSRHTTAGNPNFLPTTAEKAALKAFLMSIDESTAPFAVLPETVLCPTDFTR